MKPLVNMTVGTLLHQTAQEHPEAAAIRWHKRTINYQELDNTVDLCAKYLLHLGIKKGDHVGIWGEIDPESITLFYAIQRIGAVAVMVNTLLKKDDVANAIRLADVSILFTGISYTKGRNFLPEAKGLNDLPQLREIIPLHLEEQGSVLQRNIETSEETQKLRKRESEVDPSDTAVIIFTSGSTGNPKAVMTSHYSRVNSGIQQASDLGATTEDRFCVTIPLFHCFCVSANVMAALACGGCLCVPDDRHTISVMKALEQYHCTILHSVPTLYRALMGREDFDKWDISSLRIGIIGGSGYPPEDFERIEEKFGMTLLSSLGQTEATAGLTVSNPTDSRELRCSTVGHFMNHVEGKITEIETGETLPEGKTGEICVRGYLVMQGYYKQPDLTAQAIDCEGWLHTGDLAEMDKNGYLTMKGRIKDLIIRGGENISPIEIQDEICTLPEIAYCKIVGVPDAHYGEEACACVVCRENAEISAEQIKAYLEGRIAAYKIPRYFLFYDKLPVTTAGKVDPKAVKKMAVEALGLLTAHSVI